MNWVKSRHFFRLLTRQTFSEFVSAAIRAPKIEFALDKERLAPDLRLGEARANNSSFDSGTIRAI